MTIVRWIQTCPASREPIDRGQHAPARVLTVPGASQRASSSDPFCSLFRIVNTERETSVSSYKKCVLCLLPKRGSSEPPSAGRPPEEIQVEPSRSQTAGGTHRQTGDVALRSAPRSLMNALKVFPSFLGFFSPDTH